MVWPDPQALSRWPWRAGEARRRRRAVKHRGVQWPGVRGATEGGGVEGWWAASVVSPAWHAELGCGPRGGWSSVGAVSGQWTAG